MKVRAAAVAIWMAVGLVGMAVDANADGDAKRGEVLAYTCHGCHGVPDYKYLISALNGYAGGDRPHQTMHATAATLSDQDRADIAAFLQAEVVQPSKQVVGTPPPTTQTCVSCHGSDGAKTVGPEYPILAGQQPDYIVHALQDYKSGKRKNPIMAGIVAGLDAKDFEAIAEFFGQQHGLCSTDELREHGKCVRDSE
jgi:cytochrome c553